MENNLNADEHYFNNRNLDTKDSRNNNFNWKYIPNDQMEMRYQNPIYHGLDNGSLETNNNIHNFVSQNDNICDICKMKFRCVPSEKKEYYKCKNDNLCQMNNCHIPPREMSDLYRTACYNCHAPNQMMHTDIDKKFHEKPHYHNTFSHKEGAYIFPTECFSKDYGEMYQKSNTDEITDQHLLEYLLEKYKLDKKKLINIIFKNRENDVKLRILNDFFEHHKNIVYRPILEQYKIFKRWYQNIDGPEISRDEFENFYEKRFE